MAGLRTHETINLTLSSTSMLYWVSTTSITIVMHHHVQRWLLTMIWLEWQEDHSDQLFILFMVWIYEGYAGSIMFSLLQVRPGKCIQKEVDGLGGSSKYSTNCLASHLIYYLNLDSVRYSVIANIATSHPHNARNDLCGSSGFDSPYLNVRCGPVLLDQFACTSHKSWVMNTKNRP